MVDLKGMREDFIKQRQDAGRIVIVIDHIDNALGTYNNTQLSRKEHLTAALDAFKALKTIDMVDESAVTGKRGYRVSYNGRGDKSVSYQAWETVTEGAGPPREINPGTVVGMIGDAGYTGWDLAAQQMRQDYLVVLQLLPILYVSCMNSEPIEIPSVVDLLKTNQL